mgnify:CR=1 FL=1
MNLINIHAEEVSIAHLKEGRALLDKAIEIFAGENEIVTDLRFFSASIGERIEYKEGAALRLRANKV